jgi:hypothetical protein
MRRGTAVKTGIRRGARVGIAVALLSSLQLALLGCSLVIDPDSLLIRCSVESGQPDPCVELGMTCSSGTCQTCEPTLELCDGRDNDCDGNVDEGSDSDGDGFTWCGGGHPELVDCVPDDANIHPTRAEGDRGAQVVEACDGRDNDCDGKIDEDQRCEAMRSCAADGDCASGLQCDTESGQCVAPSNTGSLCKTDAQCGDGFCISAAAIGLGGVLSDKLCATACCKDADCPADRVCVQSGSGARVCLPAEIAGRRSTQEGERCALSADCASGVCQRSRCVATCSRDTDCAGETCRLNSTVASILTGAGSFICGEVGGRGDTNDLCTALDPVSCKSALCSDNRCAAPCAADADCPIGLSCGYVRLPSLLGGGRVTACVAREQVAAAPGATCCTNDDCGAAQVCRPMEVGDAWGMYCEGNGVD